MTEMDTHSKTPEIPVEVLWWKYGYRSNKNADMKCPSGFPVDDIAEDLLTCVRNKGCSTYATAAIQQPLKDFDFLTGN